MDWYIDICIYLLEDREVEWAPDMGASIQGWGRGHGQTKGREWAWGFSLTRGCTRKVFLEIKVVFYRDDNQRRGVGITQVP